MRIGFVMVAIKKMVTKDEVISLACLKIGSVCDISRRHFLKCTASILKTVWSMPDRIPSSVFVGSSSIIPSGQIVMRGIGFDSHDQCNL
jgi:hypothetical protein